MRCKFKECQVEKPTATEIIDHMKNCDKQPENVIVYYNYKNQIIISLITVL